MRNATITALGVLALWAGPALAQGAYQGAETAKPLDPAVKPGPTYGELAAKSRTDPFVTGLPNTGLSARSILGVAVTGLDEVRVGTVEDLLLDREGRVAAVVIGMGGVLGMGERRVAVPFDRFLWNTGDIGRADQPSASVVAGTRPAQRPPEAGATAMPGAAVSDQVLNVVPDRRSGTEDPGTGPSMTGSTGQGGSATILVTDPDGRVERAMVRHTKAELEQAPEFKAPGR